MWNSPRLALLITSAYRDGERARESRGREGGVEGERVCRGCERVWNGPCLALLITRAYRDKGRGRRGGEGERVCHGSGMALVTIEDEDGSRR